MNGNDVKNFAVSLLAKYLEIPIILSGQSELVPAPPYAYYKRITGFETETYLGIEINEIVDANTVDNMLWEQFVSTLSFTFVDETEDKAFSLCQKARNWFMHTCYEELIIEGIVIKDISPANDRTVFQLTDPQWRWGFDVQIRYVDVIHNESKGLEIIIEEEIN